MAVREITNEEGNRLLRIVRRGSGSVVRWRRAQMVLWSAQGMDVPSHRQGGLHVAGPGQGGPAQLQRGRLRLVGPPSTPGAGHRRSPCPSAGRSRRSPCPPGRPRPALFDLEPVQAGRVPRRRGGGRRHQPRGSPRAPPRGGRHLSSDQDLQAVERPRLRGQEEPGARALRHRRWQGKSEEGRSGRRDLHGRVRAAQPVAPAGQAVGAADRQG